MSGAGPCWPGEAPAGGWALFLDIDGTLLDHVGHPGAVRVDHDLHELLANLHARLAGAVALVSGRALDDVLRLFAPLRLPAAGQHGVERLDASGRIHGHHPAGDALRAAARHIAAWSGDHPGLVFEDKGASLALHYRGAPRLGDEVRRLVGALAADLGGAFELQEGKMVLEIKPAGRHKGSAVEEFMREPPFAGRNPVFIGDDLTDEHGFAVVNRLGGLSVKVGPGPTVAQQRLADAAAVRHALGRMTGRSEAGA